MWRCKGASRAGLIKAGLGVLLLLLAVPGIPVSAGADERIISYHADVQIQPDASLLVSERIRVRAEGNQIRRGIYREFPTDYRDRFGNRFRVDFELLSLSRDGAPEESRVEQRANGVRIYAGSANRFLEPGEYVYELRYRTTRQLGFFDGFDELYWNVTGNGWAFPIEAASAVITLPGDVSPDQLQTAVYTGPFGSDGRDARVEIRNSRTVLFETTAPLGPREGLTAVVGWPKGLVAEPTRNQKIQWFFRDNGGALAQLVGFLVIFGWYFWAWSHKGRDPAKGVIIPRYEPPKGLSPAACRYVLDMGFDQKAFTAAVVSLGVKGYLTIEEHDGDFTLQGIGKHATGERPPASPGEQAVLDALLPGGSGSITLDKDEYKAFGEARSGLIRALKKEYKGRLFNLNALYAVPAVLLTVLVAIVAGLLGQQNPLLWIVWAIAVSLTHLFFMIILKAPTVPGRLVMDEIEGFKMYLSTAEGQRLDRMKSPQMTPELFEMFLPYAFALGVENRWTRRFMSEIPREQREAAGYNPAWYSGDIGRAGALHHIGSKLGSELSSSISSAATPPGSSSGGGGFSGGGGGGGGGGGW